MSIALLFSISGGEIIVILIFVLLFFGSKGLPGFARGMGRTLRQVRDASNEVQREITRSAHEVRRGLEEQERKAERPEGPPTRHGEPGDSTPKD